MAEKYSFMETTIADEKFLHYHPPGAIVHAHRDTILDNSDKLRIVYYTHQVPDGSESVCYSIQDYIPLEKTFRKRRINFEELILLLYGVVHTLSNAKKCGLFEDSFILNPSHVYLKHDSIQPYLLYFPTKVDISLRDEFLTLMDFLDNVADPDIPNTKELVGVIKDIARDNFDMHAIIKVVVQTANTKEIVSPERISKQSTEKNAKVEPTSQAAAQATTAHKPQPAPRQASSPSKPAPVTRQSEQKQGFFTRFFAGWFGIKQSEPDDFLPTIDDRTMIDFTAYGDDDGKPILYVMEGNTRTAQIPVTSDAFVLGRSRNEVDFCFDGTNDKGISRVHAAIIYDGSNYFVTDKGSSGGTFVNSVRLSPSGSAPIKNGDTISLYNKHLLFEIVD